MKQSKRKKMEKVHLKNLLFDEKVADLVEKNGIKFPENFLKNIMYVPDSFPLQQSRLNKILEKYHTSSFGAHTSSFGAIAEPIFIIKTLGNKYKVENGRHRIAAAILKNNKDILAIVC